MKIITVAVSCLLSSFVCTAPMNSEPHSQQQDDIGSKFNEAIKPLFKHISDTTAILKLASLSTSLSEASEATKQRQVSLALKRIDSACDFERTRLSFLSIKHIKTKACADAVVSLCLADDEGEYFMTGVWINNWENLVEYQKHVAANCPLKTELALSKIPTVFTNDERREYVKNIRFIAFNVAANDNYPELDEKKLLIPDAIEKFRLVASKAFVPTVAFIKFLAQLLGSKLKAFDLTLKNIDEAQKKIISDALLRSKESLLSYKDVFSSLGYAHLSRLHNLKELTILDGVFNDELKVPTSLTKLEVRNLMDQHATSFVKALEKLESLKTFRFIYAGLKPGAWVDILTKLPPSTEDLVLDGFITESEEQLQELRIPDIRVDNLKSVFIRLEDVTSVSLMKVLAEVLQKNPQMAGTFFFPRTDDSLVQIIRNSAPPAVTEEDLMIR